jgi:hypothetical protein
MILSLKTSFLFLVIVKIVVSSYLSASNSNNKTELQRPFKTNSSVKDNSIRVVKSVADVISSLISSTSVGVTLLFALSKYVRANAPDECAVLIRYREKKLDSALIMNFKSNQDDNWNHETITSYDSVDKTKEKVSGGKLKVIQNYSVGKFCIEAIIYSCGSQIINKTTERMVILDVLTIQKSLV